MDDIAKILAELAQLHSAGELTDSEYSAAKKEVLSQRSSPPAAANVQDVATSAPAGGAGSFARPWMWKRIPDFRSRTRRSEFWAITAIAMAATFVLGFVDGLVFGEAFGIFMVAAFLLWVWLFWGASVNRLHDLGMHGWWVLAMLVPLLGFWFFVLVGFKKGDPGSNRWGRPVGSAAVAPEAESKWVNDSVASDGVYSIGGASGAGASGAPSGRAKQLGIVAGVAVVIAAALGVYVVATNGGAEPRRAASHITVPTVRARITVSTVAPGIGTTTTDPRNGESTSTLSDVELTGFDAQVRDFLILVEELEANGRYLQAADGENWYLWTDEYAELAEEYRNLAERWDRTYASRVEDAEPGFGQTVSHALIRRSDGYRLVYTASTPEAVNDDIDSWYYMVGVEAIDEASALFSDLARRTPEKWQDDVGIAGSALTEIMKVDLQRIDPIPVDEWVVGDCFENPVGLSVYEVPREECATGAVEIVWLEDIGPYFEGFPGEDHVQEFSHELCLGRAEDRYPFSGARDGGLWTWSPNAELWSSGDTVVTCTLEL